MLTDKDGYIPWFTYPAIEALKTWDLSDKSVLEYGSGYSTLFWARCTKHVVSIEQGADDIFFLTRDFAFEHAQDFRIYTNYYMVMDDCSPQPFKSSYEILSIL